MNYKFLIACFIFVLLAGCKSEDPGLIREGDVVLVEVDGEPITKAMLEYLMTVRGVADKAMAVAQPMPEPAPVTRAQRPASSDPFAAMRHSPR